MRFVAVLALAGAAFAADEPGVKPRMGAADYPTQAENQSVAIGAALLSPDQVRGAFATDLNRGYLVLEVGMYPKAGGKVDVGPGDFSLRVAGTRNLSRAASPRAVASVLQKSAASQRDITLYPQVGIGYETGPAVYDPVTGTRRGGGLSTSTGVGVGVGGNKPASTNDDRKTMELELSDKQLPEKVTATPVAGYLYFPLPTRRKGVSYELDYDGPAGRLTLPLPATEAKGR